ncbi:MAG: hypothetical protein A3G87_08060 [Omnitrophica bacterium RIFCSPLOWO2_12_FULL_50_11]|nr:MAG: hypothetical protein A3G87_08060 [Omnitrophica bacterium RIFCSPLOWO2_12_FULL_50_11]
MRILHRYCLRELVAPFLLSLVLVTFIFLVANLFTLADLVINKGVSFFEVLKLLVLMIPELLGFILPTGTLAAVLLVFGAFAQNNEILAMKASGLHLFHVFAPVVAIAFFLSLFSLFLIDQLQPASEYRSRQIVRKMLVQRPAAYLEAGRFVKDFQDYTFWINKVDGNRLKGVTIFQHLEDKPTRTIMAEWAEIIPSEDEKSFALRLHSGTSDEVNPEDPSVFYKLDFKTLLLQDIVLGRERGGVDKKEKEMSIDELLYRLKHDATVKSVPKRERTFKAEIHKKISFSFATLVFVLVGLPAAILSRRGEAVVSFSVAMGMVAIYYVLFVAGRTAAVFGYLPAWIALWLPNVLLVAVALFLGRKVVQL